MWPRWTMMPCSPTCATNCLPRLSAMRSTNWDGGGNFCRRPSDPLRPDMKIVGRAMPVLEADVFDEGSGSPGPLAERIAHDPSLPWSEAPRAFGLTEPVKLNERTPVVGTQGRALLAWVRAGQWALSRNRTGPILKNSGPSAFSAWSISRQSLALLWATESAGSLISPSLAQFGLQRCSRRPRSAEVACRSKPERLSHPLSGSASA